MPQLDATTYPGVFTYLFVTFMGVYLLVTTFVIPYVTCALKLRYKLTSDGLMEGGMSSVEKTNIKKSALHDNIITAELMRLKLRLLKGYTRRRVKKYDASRLSAYYVTLLSNQRKSALWKLFKVRGNHNYKG